jgi:hypothetical protein
MLGSIVNIAEESNSINVDYLLIKYMIKSQCKIDIERNIFEITNIMMKDISYDETYPIYELVYIVIILYENDYIMFEISNSKISRLNDSNIQLIDIVDNNYISLTMISCNKYSEIYYAFDTIIVNFESMDNVEYSRRKIITENIVMNIQESTDIPITIATPVEFNKNINMLVIIGTSYYICKYSTIVNVRAIYDENFRVKLLCHNGKPYSFMNKININQNQIDTIIGINVENYSVVPHTQEIETKFHNVIMSEFFNIYDTFMSYPKYNTNVNKIYQIIIEQVFKTINKDNNVLFYDIYLNPNIFNILNILTTHHCLLFGDFFKYVKYLMRNTNKTKMISISINNKANSTGKFNVSKLNNIIKQLNEMVKKVDNMFILSSFYKLWDTYEQGYNNLLNISSHLNSNGIIYIVGHVCDEIIVKDMFDIRNCNFIMNTQNAYMKGNYIVLNDKQYNISNVLYNDFETLVEFVSTWSQIKYKRKRLLTITQAKNLCFIFGITDEIGVPKCESGCVVSKNNDRRILIETSDSFVDVNDDVYIVVSRDELMLTVEHSFEFRTEEFYLYVYTHDINVPSLFEILSYIIDNKYSALYNVIDEKLTKQYLTPTCKINIGFLQFIFNVNILNIDFDKYVEYENYDDLKCISISKIE